MLSQTQEKLSLVVFTHDGGILAGEFVSLERDSLILLSGNTILRLGLNDATKIIVSSNRQSSSFAAPGVLLGGYAAVALSSQLESIPSPPFAFTTMLEDDGGLLLPIIFTLPGVLVGGLIGYLASPSNDEKKEVYEMTDPRSRLRALDRLGSHLWDAEGNDAAWHLIFHGAWVPTPIVEKFSKDAQASSYTTYSRSGSTSLNLARRIQLTYSVSQTVEIGVAHLWLGEPRTRADYYGPAGSYDLKSCILRPRVAGNFIVGNFNPQFFPRTSPLEIKLGGGAGLVAWECSIDGSSSSTEPQRHFKSESGSWLSGYVNAEARLRGNDNFFVGLVGDILFTPSTEITLPSQFFLPPQKMHANQWSFGFMMGVQF